MNTKTSNNLKLLLLFPLFLSACAKEEPGIEGNCGHWLSNDTVAVKALAVYGKRDMFQTEASFWHVIMNIRNDRPEDLDIRWVRAEFSGKGVRPNMVWCPLFPLDSLPEQHTVKGIINVGPIGQAQIDAEEADLDFVPRRLGAGETCATLVMPANPGDPTEVKIKVCFANGTQSRPFRIAVGRQSED
jgi:hypothetical protein